MSLILGYEDYYGEMIVATASVFHMTGAFNEIWIVITDVLNESTYDEKEKQLKYQDIRFKELFNDVLSRYLPGLHLNHIRFFYVESWLLGLIHTPSKLVHKYSYKERTYCFEQVEMKVLDQFDQDVLKLKEKLSLNINLT